MSLYLNQFLSFWRYVLRQFSINDASYRAAALTYASLLAIVPLMVVLLKIFSLLPIYLSLTTKVQKFLIENFVVTKGGLVYKHLNDFTHQAGHLSYVGTIFLVITAITVLIAIEKIFNQIWSVTMPDYRLKTILRYWVGLLIPPAILLSALIITSIIISVPIFEIRIPIISIKLLSTVPVVLTVLGFSSLYFLVPNCKVRFRDAFLAGLFSTLLFVLSKWILAWYLGMFSVYTLIYGTFGIVPILLLWFYIIWLITLLGAEVCHALGYRNAR